jgi:hypothetical protein
MQYRLRVWPISLRAVWVLRESDSVDGIIGLRTKSSLAPLT